MKKANDLSTAPSVPCRRTSYPKFGLKINQPRDVIFWGSSYKVLKITGVRACSSPHAVVYTAANRENRCKTPDSVVKWLHKLWGNRGVVSIGAAEGGAGLTLVRVVGGYRELILKTKNQKGSDCPSFLGVARRLPSSCTLLLWESVFGRIQTIILKGRKQICPEDWSVPAWEGEESLEQ